MGEIAAEEREFIRMTVWSGFHDLTEIDDIAEDIRLDNPDLDDDTVRSLIVDEFALKSAEETTWPAVTDCDRLDAAFDALRADRVLALHDAGYTLSDGHEEAAEMLAQESPGWFLGYCFYHRQDVERVIEENILWVAFDHVDGDVADKAVIGRRVSASLRAAGLHPSWAGDPEQRIKIEPFDWKRRFRGRSGRSV